MTFGAGLRGAGRRGSGYDTASGRMSHPEAVRSSSAPQPRPYTLSARSPSAPLPQLDVTVDGGESHAATTLAECGAQVARVDAAGDGHGPIGLKAAVDGAQLDVCVDVLAEFGDDAAVDGGEIEVGVA